MPRGDASTTSATAAAGTRNRSAIVRGATRQIAAKLTLIYESISASATGTAQGA